MITKYVVKTDNSRVEFLTEEERDNYLLEITDSYTLETTQEEEPVPEIYKQPKEVALWRIRAILRAMELEDPIQQAILQLPEPNKTVANVAWEYAYTIDRWSNTVEFIKGVLGLTEEQVDNIFTQAEALKV
jgi:hypothetical protein